MTMRIILSISSVFFLLVLCPAFGEAQVQSSMPGHMAMAKSYEDQADFFRQEIEALKKLKAKHGRIPGIYIPKDNPLGLRTNEEYYAELIREGEAIASEFELRAQWHRAQAESDAGPQNKEVDDVDHTNSPG